MNLNGWRGALGGISSCSLVFTGDHLHPSLSALLLTQQILLETSLCQVLLSALGMLQRMCFQMSESRTGPWRAMQSPWMMMALLSWSFSSLSPFLPPNCSQSPYLRFQSRLHSAWECPESSVAFSGWCSGSPFSAALCPAPDIATTADLFVPLPGGSLTSFPASWSRVTLQGSAEKNLNPIFPNHNELLVLSPHENTSVLAYFLFCLVINWAGNQSVYFSGQGHMLHHHHLVYHSTWPFVKAQGISLKKYIHDKDVLEIRAVWFKFNLITVHFRKCIFWRKTIEISSQPTCPSLTAQFHCNLYYSNL